MMKSRKNRKRQILLAVILLVIVSLACGNGSEPATVATATPGAPVSDVDEPIDEDPAEIVEPEPDVPELGTSRSNPAPLGSSLTVDKGSLTLVVEEVIRPADDIAYEANMFNTPGEGKEYLMARISLKCEVSEDDICKISSMDFKAVGSLGEIYDTSFVAGISDELGSEELFGGAKASRLIFFEVQKTDEGLLLIHEPWLSLSPVRTFLALE